MDTFKDHDFAINWKLFKQCRYNKIIYDSNLLKIKEWNGCQMLLMISFGTSVATQFFGIMGFFINVDNNLQFLGFITTVYAIIHSYLFWYKLCILIYYSKNIWDILEVSQIKFLKSIQCAKNIKILLKHRDKTIKLTNIYGIWSFYTIVIWMLFPLAIEIYIPSDTQTERKQNVVNLLFPFPIHTYNEYYVIFYAIETFWCGFFMYGMFMIDLFVLSFGWVIIAQYRVINRSFQDIGQEIDSEKYNFQVYYDQFITVIKDLARLDQKMKTYYRIVRPILLVYVAINSLLITTLTFVLVSVFHSSNLDSKIAILKLGSAELYLAFQLSLYCYLCDTMNDQRESISFGMYSCNWIVMNLKFKKLLLLSIRTNDINILTIKFTPKKIVNMQLFSSVLLTSCNIVSIMLKVMGDNNQQAV